MTPSGRLDSAPPSFHSDDIANDIARSGADTRDPEPDVPPRAPASGTTRDHDDNEETSRAAEGNLRR